MSKIVRVRQLSMGHMGVSRHDVTWPANKIILTGSIGINYRSGMRNVLNTRRAYFNYYQNFVSGFVTVSFRRRPPLSIDFQGAKTAQTSNVCQNSFESTHLLQNKPSYLYNLLEIHKRVRS